MIVSDDEATYEMLAVAMYTAAELMSERCGGRSISSCLRMMADMVDDGLAPTTKPGGLLDRTRTSASEPMAKPPGQEAALAAGAPVEPPQGDAG